MRALKFLVVAMGVLIVIATTALVVIIAKRMANPPPPPGGVVATVLSQPAGTSIVAIAATEGRTLLQLRGGGPDRVVAVDPRTGKVVGRIRLSQ